MKRELNRRDILKLAGTAALAMGTGMSSPAWGGTKASPETVTDKHDLLMRGTVNFKGFMAKEITPNDEFYITTYSSTVPQTFADSFRLKVGGLVRKPLSLSLADLRQIKDKTEFVTLECIGNPVGGDAISNALWDGVTLKKVIERAGPRDGIVKVAFHADDGYSDSIPYSLALSDDVFLAFGMNEKPLPRKHGFPLRVVVPGIYGMKSVKWVSKIELLDYDYKGYWEKRGWSDEAVIPVRSQILMPMEGKTIKTGAYVIGGVAFGGRYGIGRVQVSVDNGETWKEAELKAPLSKWAWTLWRRDWDPLRAGDYTVKVRGFDRQGRVQESPSIFGKILGTYPNGAKGIHGVNVKIIA